MTDLEDSRRALICKATRAQDAHCVERLQQLWSGYGELLRYRLEGAAIETVILKDVNLQGGSKHPRGWNTDVGHQRKLHSYEVEAAWYQHHAAHCTDHCRVPACLGVERSDDQVQIVLEDLDSAGFPMRRDHAGLAEARTGLRWLAAFHATFLGVEPKGLWPTGTYWHLATRSDEWNRLPDGSMKNAASAIDQKLNEANYQTVVHGDAKLANFCFSEDGKSVAAVDFQYVGGGCGMKDVAYFIGSVFEESDCARFEEELLNEYFCALRAHLPVTVEADDIESEWRSLYPAAWTDFHRFLLGWSPGHWKLHRYSEQLAQQTLEEIANSAPKAE